MSYPTITVEIRFGVGPFDGDTGSTDFTDVSDKVLAFTTTSGRGSQFEASTPGEASVTLDNQTRDFDPWYAAGPHAGELLPGRQIRITADWDGDTYPVWAGWSEDWPQTYQPPEQADIQVPFVDALGLVAVGILPESVWADLVANANLIAWYRLGERTGRVMQDSSGENRVGKYFGSDPLSDSSPSLIVGSKDPAVHLDPYDEWAMCNDVTLGPQAGSGRQYEFWWRGDPRPGRRIAEFRLFAAGGPNGEVAEIVYDSGYGLCIRILDFPEVSMWLGRLWPTRHMYLHVPAGGTGWKLWINGVDRTGDLSATGRTPKRRAVKGVRIGDVVPGLVAGATSHTIFDEVVVGSRSLTPSTGAVNNRYQAGIHPWQGDSTKARLNHVLGAVGLSALQGDDTMSTTHRTWRLGAAHLESDAVSYVQRIEATEQGRLYTYFDGTDDPTLRLLEHEPFEATLPLAATFTDDPTPGGLHYDTITMDTGAAWIRNVITVNYPDTDGESNGTVTKSDFDSIAKHGRKELTVDTLLSSALDGKDLAEFLLLRFKDPRPRVTDLVFTPAADPVLWPAALSLKVGDRVQVVRSPQQVGPSIVADCRIDGIDHDASDGVDHWQTTLRLSLIDLSGWFVWGVTEWGGTDHRWYV